MSDVSRPTEDTTQAALFAPQHNWQTCFDGSSLWREQSLRIIAYLNSLESESIDAPVAIYPQKPCETFMDEDAYRAWLNLTQWTEYEAMSLLTDCTIPPYFLFDSSLVNDVNVNDKRKDTPGDFITLDKADGEFETLRQRILEARHRGTLSLTAIPFGNGIVCMSAPPSVWLAWAMSADVEIPEGLQDVMDCSTQDDGPPIRSEGNNAKNSTEATTTPGKPECRDIRWSDYTFTLGSASSSDDTKRKEIHVIRRDGTRRVITPQKLGLLGRHAIPLKAWRLLEDIILLKGCFPIEQMKSRDRERTKKHLTKLNQALKREFSADTNPIQYKGAAEKNDYKGWKAAFKCRQA